MADWTNIKIGLAELWDEFAGRTENPDYDADWRRRPASAWRHHEPVMDRPPQPRYTPHRCYALTHPDDTTTHCMQPARLYPVGWRCDPHRPGANRTRPTTQEEA